MLDYMRVKLRDISEDCCLNRAMDMCLKTEVGKPILGLFRRCPYVALRLPDEEEGIVIQGDFSSCVHTFISQVRERMGHVRDFH